MTTRPILDKDLVDAVKNFKGSNRLIFGVNSDKPPEPILVKKMLLMLIGAKILVYHTERKEKSEGKFIVTVFGALAFVAGSDNMLALDDDSYWIRLPLKE
jgi:hypothetical protein